MKKTVIFLCNLAFVLGVVGAAGATPVDFDLAGADGGSSVSVTEVARRANLTATLATTLDDQIFTLADGQTQTVDFFSLTASGLGGGQYSIAATLAFEAPPIDDAVGSGSGTFFTIFGLVSGGTLTWDPSSLPDFFTTDDGNTIMVDFEDGCAFGLGNTVTVHAYITNQGGAHPVPEPSMMLLMATTFVGLIAVRRMGLPFTRESRWTKSATS